MEKQIEKKDSYGIYLHIPFCKQACHYCNYHFSTTLKKKGDLVEALIGELALRKDELNGVVRTVYFGGGTPSLLSEDELGRIFEALHRLYPISSDAEITLEANPDDLVDEGDTTAQDQKLKFFKSIGINRLSIGIQSFFESDLRWMNRAHNASEGIRSVEAAKKYFDNLSIDLIYGIPGMTDARWQENLNQAFSFDIPHLSCYALTVEPRTALEKFIETGKSAPVDDDLAQIHHASLIRLTEAAGYDNYEFSNFGKPGYYSQNNTAYWEGKSYLGIGPSAHSYDGKSRSWNVENNSIYIRNIRDGIRPYEDEVLTQQDQYNEYVMTRLRTSSGIDLEKVVTVFGEKYLEYLLNQAELGQKAGNLIIDDKVVKVSRKGKFLTDGLAADLFWI